MSADGSASVSDGSTGASAGAGGEREQMLILRLVAANTTRVVTPGGGGGGYGKLEGLKSGAGPTLTKLRAAGVLPAADDKKVTPRPRKTPQGFVMSACPPGAAIHTRAGTGTWLTVKFAVVEDRYIGMWQWVPPPCVKNKSKPTLSADAADATGWLPCTLESLANIVQFREVSAWLLLLLSVEVLELISGADTTLDDFVAAYDSCQAKVELALLHAKKKQAVSRRESAKVRELALAGEIAEKRRTIGGGGGGGGDSNGSDSDSDSDADTPVPTPAARAARNKVKTPVACAVARTRGAADADIESESRLVRQLREDVLTLKSLLLLTQDKIVVDSRKRTAENNFRRYTEKHRRLHESMPDDIKTVRPARLLSLPLSGCSSSDSDSSDDSSDDAGVLKYSAKCNTAGCAVSDFDSDSSQSSDSD